MADWDVVVIGGGAAGLSAAAAAASAGRRCVLIDRMGGGGELMNLATTLHGLDEETTGPDLGGRLLEEALGAGVELAIDEVTALAREGDRWVVTTAEDSHAAPAVVLAIGLAPGTLGLDNEHDFEGRGLSHCAACDGPLYRGDPVVVVGTDRWAVQEALDLVPTAGSVALVTQGAGPVAVPGVTVLPGRVTALAGDAGLEAVEVTQAGAAPRRIPARAIFIQAGRKPALDFAPGDLARAPGGRIAVDESLRCSIPGLFAVGEARGGFLSTLKAAMEDGQIVAAALTRQGTLKTWRGRANDWPFRTQGRMAWCPPEGSLTTASVPLTASELASGLNRRTWRLLLAERLGWMVQTNDNPTKAAHILLDGLAKAGAETALSGSDNPIGVQVAAALDGSPAVAEFLDRLVPMGPEARRVESQASAVEALLETTIEDWLASALPSDGHLD